MEQAILNRGTNRGRRTPAAKKSAKLRVIAQLPFNGTVSVKVIDAAIKAVMAKRNAKARRAVHIGLPGDSPLTGSASK